MQQVTMHQCACLIRPISFKANLQALQALVLYSAHVLSMIWLLLNPVFRTNASSVYTPQTCLPSVEDVVALTLNIQRHVSVSSSCCWSIQLNVKSNLGLQTLQTNVQVAAAVSKLYSKCTSWVAAAFTLTETEFSTYKRSVSSSTEWRMWHLVLD